MPTATANGIQIAYDEFGKRDDPAVLLIMGFAAQLVVWPEAFCQALADRGFRIIRFDNRDVGLSTHLDGVKAPGMLRSMAASLIKVKLKTPYTLEDMALDAIGLLDALGIRDAHIVGASMGAMIGQIMAAKHASRVRSLTSWMSTSGKYGLPGPRPRVLRHVLFGHKKNMSAEAMRDFIFGLWKLTASPGYPTPPDDKRRLIASWIERNCDPAANVRQFAAMAANGDRTPLLQTIRRPTLVIHGADDSLIPVAGGQHTASCIEGARLHVIPGMGHDLPDQLIPKIAEMIASHCNEAQDGATNKAGRIAVNE